ncbi:hypothetical protein [Mucilaginibacter polytrichastri]|uniref:Uncharacterized protein n=1 Tax=Mucilaginibacter polytrichastri TaxID=1302689 RepID=A0A1Q6A394_9SPHI|nr:hypothetical protein [Mucilaginibacter polytrichastri]OKS88486.1 hypothetical protein RG47T_3954 [Mucilaginibacter polytrichastri]SFT12139.1 hypothetical protein SAMN04487890_111137 [Mucilaginibacter polytrichastri]
MKKLLIILLAATALLPACSTYQMNTISSTNTTRDEKTGEFKLENDSVRIIYSFAGENAPIHMNIYNKLNEPVYVDWERSAFITGNQSYSYADDAVQISGDISGTSVGRGISFSNSNINAQATLPKNVAFIPPHAQITKTISRISRSTFRYISDSAFIKAKLPASFGAENQKVKMAKFDKDSSPLFFKSYLTVYTLNGNTPKFTAYQNDFYVSQIIRSSQGPENFEFYQSGRGDLFTSSGSVN